jgi:hypothetical protein
VHRLIAKRREINDFQSDSAQGNICGIKDALLVRSSMNQALRGSLYSGFGNVSVFVGKTGNAAQFQ